MQFGGHPGNISNSYSVTICAGEVAQLGLHFNHALLLPSKHYQIMPKVPYLLHCRIV